MKKQVLFLALGVAIAASLAAATVAQAADTAKTVKVFLLAGQSNMQGMAFTADMEKQAENLKYKDLYKNLRKDGKWIVREDVFLKYGKHKAPLTVGFGGARRRTGVEFAFGSMMGDHFDEPVLLIKTAWGGHSLFQQFCSPSRLPEKEKKFQQDMATWEKAHEAALKIGPKIRLRDPGNVRFKPQPYGSSYRAMLAEVKETFDKYETMFPALKGRKLELAGFVWFQGWNDMYGGAENEYASNMKHFIKDVRKDLGVPNLPFVIGALGQNGSKPATGGMLAVREAQMAMNDVPEFKGNVKAFRADLLADKEAERVYEGWQKHIEEWNKVGSDRPYHYLGSAIWFNRIGKAMGEAMLELLKGQKE